MKHTRIDRATTNFPSLWVYSICTPELALSSETKPDKKKIFTAYNPVGRKITKQSFSLIRGSSARQRVETASAQTFGHALTSSLPCLKLGGSAQNSQKRPEYERMVRVKVSPLETAVAVDAASSPGAALPPHARAAPLLHGEQLHWGKKKKPSAFKAWPPDYVLPRGHIKSDSRALMAALLQKGPELQTLEIPQNHDVRGLGVYVFQPMFPTLEGKE